MPAYEFVYIDDGFLHSLEDSVLNGDSTLIIGPRYVGKRDILNEIEERLNRTAAQANLICKLLFTERNALTDAELCRTLNRALPEKLRFNPDELPTAPAELLGRLDDSFILMVSGIDSIPQPVAQRFLRALEPRVETLKIVPLLCGEADVREMLGGIRSDFRIHKRYFVLGYGKEEFQRKVLELTKHIGLWLTEPDAGINFLYEQTGGNFHVAEVMLRQLRYAGDNEASTNDRSDHAFDAAALQRLLKAMTDDLSWREPVALNAVYQIFQAPLCCKNLDELIHNGRFSSESIDDTEAPIVLELAGAAKRVLKSRNGSSGLSANALKVDFTFSSPLMETFLKGYFDEIRLGDLYVSSGDWESAIKRYGSASTPEKRMRPRNAGDRSRAEFVVRSLCSMLHTTAADSANPVDKVDNLFEEGCRYFLGFQEVSFFRWSEDHEGAGSWQLTKSDVKIGQKEYATILNSLPPGDQLETSFDVLPYPSFTTGIGVRGQHSGEREALILSDFTGRTPISPARRRIMEELISHYVRARDNAMRTDNNARRIRVLQHYQKINRFIGDRLREQLMDVNEVLDYVGEQIMDLGYSSVALGYYSRLEEKCLCGVYMRRGAGKPVPERQWPSLFLEQKHLDAVRSRKDQVVEDEHKQKYWIFPLRAGDTEEVTHTLMVQQLQAGEIDQERQSDLKNFGEQLIEAIQQSERTILLQSSLNDMAEPVAIVDVDFRVRYANFASTKIFNLEPVKAGLWQSAQQAPLAAHIFTGWKADKIMEWLDQSLRYVSPLQSSLLPFSPIGGDELGLGKNSLFNGRIEIGSIRNSRERVIGSYLRAQDFAELRCIFAVTQLLFAASSQDVLISLLLNINRTPQQWRRFYRIDASTPHLLIGAGAMGEPSVDLKAFAEGKRVLDRRESDGSEWQCFDDNAPVLFEAWATAKRETANGVKVIPVPNPRWEGLLGKVSGELWLDVPLVSPARMGKLSMFCDENIRPQDVEFWRVLGAAAGSMMAVLQREAEGQQNAALAAERVFLSSVAHGIHTRLASLSTVRSQYSIFEKENRSSVLREINDQFKSCLSSLQGTMDRVKRQLGQLTISPEKFGIREAMEQFIDKNRLRQQCAITSDPDEIEILGDPILLEEAMSELLSNSRDALSAGEQLKLKIDLKQVFLEEKQWVRISYSDNGPGVPIDMRSLIFNLFFTHRTNGTQGTGVGLYHVQRIMIKHGGRIKEDGSPGAGALFIMELPVNGLGGRI